MNAVLVRVWPAAKRLTTTAWLPVTASLLVDTETAAGSVDVAVVAAHRDADVSALDWVCNAAK